MLVDFIIGILASLAASLITGFLGNKAISKSNSTILKVYVLFLATSIFVVGAVLSVILNKQFNERIATISEANLLRFYNNCVSSFVFILLIIAGVSIGVLLIEAFHRAELRDQKDSLKRYKNMR